MTGCKIEVITLLISMCIEVEECGYDNTFRDSYVHDQANDDEHLVTYNGNICNEDLCLTCRTCQVCRHTCIHDHRHAMVRKHIHQGETLPAGN